MAKRALQSGGRAKATGGKAATTGCPKCCATGCCVNNDADGYCQPPTCCCGKRFRVELHAKVDATNTNGWQETYTTDSSLIADCETGITVEYGRRRWKGVHPPLDPFDILSDGPQYADVANLFPMCNTRAQAVYSAVALGLPKGNFSLVDDWLPPPGVWEDGNCSGVFPNGCKTSWETLAVTCDGGTIRWWFGDPAVCGRTLEGTATWTYTRLDAKCCPDDDGPGDPIPGDPDENPIDIPGDPALVPVSPGDNPFGSVGNPALLVRWLGLDWRGTPAPIQWLTGKAKVSGCGCAHVPKTLWERWRPRWAT